MFTTLSTVNWWKGQKPCHLPFVSKTAAQRPIPSDHLMCTSNVSVCMSMQEHVGGSHHVHVCECVHECVHVYACVQVCEWVCVCMPMSVCVCGWVCLSMCMCVYMCVILWRLIVIFNLTTYTFNYTTGCCPFLGWIFLIRFFEAKGPP